jgi:hypothetical protein
MNRRLIARNEDGFICNYADRKVLRIEDFASLPESDPIPKHTIGLKGAFGAGKSSLCIGMIARDSEHFYLTANTTDKKPIGTFLPRYNTAIIGTYLNPCGGCDGLAPRMVQEYLRLLWPYNVHIVYEGAIVAGIISTFYELSKELRQEHYREISFCFLNTPVTECIRRIYVRNGGKPFNEANVAAKDGSVWSSFEHYVRKGDVRCSVLNTNRSKEEVLDCFLELYPELNASQSQQPGNEIGERKTA